MGFDYGDHDKAWNDGDWFNKLGGRCQFTGRPVGHADGRYHPWARHHTASKVYSDKEKLRPGWNYILLTKWSHWLVHFLGGQLVLNSGNIRSQNRQARRLPLTVLWKYPNILQRCFHSWCRLPHRMKLVITWLVESSILILFCWASYFFYELYRNYGITPAQFVVEFFRFW